MDTDFGNREIIDKIIRIKQELGNKLLILTHHYQRKDIVDLGDHRGDTFALARRAARDENARYIVFCGVHFMADSAAVLAKGNQVVQIPDINAGCWMADMADEVTVEKAWEEAAALLGEARITPVAYINSELSVKAHCGRHQGTVCTSSNARQAFEWAFQRREKIFFVPDEHLGRNTAMAMGIPEEQILVWNPELPLGGNTEQALDRSRVILWKGHCLVHTRFTPEQIHTMRANFPGAKVVVHPECPHEVVRLADACGSTGFIVRYVTEAPPDSTLLVGTEINLIKRLAAEHPDKKILPLHDSFCPNMHKINLKNLLYTLENIGKANVILLDEAMKKEAFVALSTMLNL